MFKKAIMFLSAEEDVLTDCLSLDSLDREEMKSLQAALQKQLDEANERAEKQQATVRRAELTVSLRSLLNGPVTCHTDHSVFRAHYPAGLLFSIFTSLHHLIEALRKGLIRPCVFSLTPTVKLKRRVAIITQDHVLIYPSI